MDWIEVAQVRDRWDVRLWTGSRWLRIRTCVMCSYGLDRVGSGYGQVGCAVLDWIELAQDTDRWDVLLCKGSSWLRLRTGGMCGYELDGTG